MAYAFEYFVVGENLALEKSRATAGPLKAFRGRPGWKPGFLLFLASTSVEIFFKHVPQVHSESRAVLQSTPRAGSCEALDPCSFLCEAEKTTVMVLLESN